MEKYPYLNIQYAYTNRYTGADTVSVSISADTFEFFFLTHERSRLSYACIHTSGTFDKLDRADRPF